MDMARAYEAIMVEDTDLELVYNTALETSPDKKDEVQYLLGIIEGTLGKYFKHMETDTHEH